MGLTFCELSENAKYTFSIRNLNSLIMSTLSSSSSCKMLAFKSQRVPGYLARGAVINPTAVPMARDHQEQVSATQTMRGANSVTSATHTVPVFAMCRAHNNRFDIRTQKPRPGFFQMHQCQSPCPHSYSALRYPSPKRTVDPALQTIFCKRRRDSKSSWYPSVLCQSHADAGTS